MGAEQHNSCQGSSTARSPACPQERDCWCQLGQNRAQGPSCAWLGFAFVLLTSNFLLQTLYRHLECGAPQPPCGLLAGAAGPWAAARAQPLLPQDQPQADRNHLLALFFLERATTDPSALSWQCCCRSSPWPRRDRLEGSSASPCSLPLSRCPCGAFLSDHSVSCHGQARQGQLV